MHLLDKRRVSVKIAILCKWLQLIFRIHHNYAKQLTSMQGKQYLRCDAQAFFGPDTFFDSCQLMDTATNHL